VKRQYLLRLGVMAICATAAPAFAGPGPTPLPTTISNFYQRGTQPNSLMPNNEIVTAAADCANCHSNTAPIHNEWAGSLMANAARDPLFYACLEIADADAPGAGDLCIRCHAPKAWLEGRSTPTNGSMITQADRDGITCNFCHRLVDPFDVLADAPVIDAQILSALGADAPVQAMNLGMPAGIGFGGGGSYVVDTFDRRRGPFPLAASLPVNPGEAFCSSFHFSATSGKCLDSMSMPTGCDTFESPFHRRSEICATCHDVSAPHFQLNGAGTAFVFNGAGVNHPDGNKYHMVPIERTFSEWLQSGFSAPGGIDMGGRFGGPGGSIISSCQDCHLPQFTAQGCVQPFSNRDDLPHHFLSGASSWQLDAIDALYGDAGTLSPGEVSSAALDLNKRRNMKMLRCAADLDVALDDSLSPGVNQLRVRVTNQTGHKLPSGYPEGRRIWITVQFFDCTNSLSPILEYGAYDLVTGILDSAGTKVYEVIGGIDSALATLTGGTVGPSSHFVLTNTILKDNRIPPRGFTNAGFSAVQAEPVSYTYADGQYWDDTFFQIPPYATGVHVTLYYQATSKEYIEFLRDENPNFGVPGNAGQTAFDLWDTLGGRIPVTMAVFPPPPGPPDPNDPCQDTDPSVANVCNCPAGPDPMVVDPDGDGLFDVELKGDMDGDRDVTINDVPIFVQVLLGLDTDPRRICAADMDDTDGPTGRDIQQFVDSTLAP